MNSRECRLKLCLDQIMNCLKCFNIDGSKKYKYEHQIQCQKFVTFKISDKAAVANFFLPELTSFFNSKSCTLRC